MYHFEKEHSVIKLFVMHLLNIVVSAYFTLGVIGNTESKECKDCSYSDFFSILLHSEINDIFYFISVM